MRRRAQGHTTVPSLLVEERQHNPFLRLHVPSLRSAVAAAVRDSRGSEMPEVPVLAALRKLKDAKAHIPQQERALGASGKGGSASAGGTSTATASRDGGASGVGVSGGGGGGGGEEDEDGLRFVDPPHTAAASGGGGGGAYKRVPSPPFDGGGGEGGDGDGDGSALLGGRR
jgi:hypothetical protein